MGKHALLSASGASRWLACPPSAKLEEKFPRNTSKYAEEGTAAHELAEIFAADKLKSLTIKEYEKKIAVARKSPYNNSEMEIYANDYASFIFNKVETSKIYCPDTFVELEAKKLDFSEYAPGGFGTGDCIIIADEVLEIIDFKYGKGYLVSAENNPQIRLYAIGALNRYGALYDVNRIRMTIFQPRISKEPSTEEITVEDLMNWAVNYVKPRAELAVAGKGEFAPSADTCKFCRAKEQCSARTNKNMALFDDAPDIFLITPKEAGKILEKATDIKAWLSDLENLVLKTLFDGSEVEGWKLVEGRSIRKYLDEIKVVEAMKKAGFEEALLYERSLLSLTNMEKNFGKKTVEEVLAGLIVKPQGRPTLASEKDKRPAFSPKELILEAFDKEEE